MAQKNQNDTFSLYGNLGGDPEPHSLPAKTGTRRFYDPILDDVVEREYELPERNFLTFSLATGGYGDKPVRWHYCVDWEGLAFRLRQGDREAGYLLPRSWTATTKNVRILLGSSNSRGVEGPGRVRRSRVPPPIGSLGSSRIGREHPSDSCKGTCIEPGAGQPPAPYSSLPLSRPGRSVIPSLIEAQRRRRGHLRGWDKDPWQGTLRSHRGECGTALPSQQPREADSR